MHFLQVLITFKLQHCEHSLLVVASLHVVVYAKKLPSDQVHLRPKRQRYARYIEEKAPVLPPGEALINWPNMINSLLKELFDHVTIG